MALGMSVGEALDWMPNKAGGKDLIFTATDLTYTPSSNPYEITSGINNIIIDKSVEYIDSYDAGIIQPPRKIADFRGGLTLSQDSTLNFVFKGAKSIHTNQDGKYYYHQDFYFGSSSSSNLEEKQISNLGVLNFNFAGGTSEIDRYYGVHFGNYDDKNTHILNQGEVNFVIKPYAQVFFDGVIENRNIINIDVQKGSVLQFSRYSSQGQMNHIIDNYKTLNFNFAGQGFIDVPALITQVNATTTFNVHDSCGGGIETNVENHGKTIFNFDRTLFVGVASDRLQSDVKDGIVFNIKNHSTVAIHSEDANKIEASNVKLTFDGGENKVFLSTMSLSKLENPSNQSNKVSSERVGIYGDYVVLRNDFQVLEIGSKGDNTTGISGNNLSFVVYANTTAKGQKWETISCGDNCTTSIPKFENGNPVLDTAKVPTLGGNPLQRGTYVYADKIIIHSSVNNQGGTHFLGVSFNYWDLKNNLSSITYTSHTEGKNDGDVSIEGNIAVASVAKDSNVVLKSLEHSVAGFNLVSVDFQEVSTDASGIHQVDDLQNTYTTYFLSSAEDKGIAPSNQSISSSALALNYDLFIANFNSLNKRMGELRENDHSQGVWGRIFNGQISNGFSGSQNNYTTIQLGYDHKLGDLKESSNYLGVSVAYALGLSAKSINAKDFYQSRSITDIYSNAFEVAIYNSYVQDEGWFSDSIAKFSYLKSDFNLTLHHLSNSTAQKQNTSNYAFILSEEFGYRFRLGESKEWFIDPQLEMALGYFSDTDLKQVVGEFYLDAKADSVLMLRSRIGSSFGYNFKKFTQNKEFKALLYAGLSYEFDYINGGNIALTPNAGKKSTIPSVYQNDGRGVLNIGTNLEVKEQTRIYADIQTSFGGKITNDYQINFGVRYSFGEKAKTKEVKNKKDSSL